MTETPISVVVVIFGTRRGLSQCLEALMQQELVHSVQVVVPCDRRIRDVPALREQFPSVQFLKVSGNATYAELRALGVKTAKGRIVAVTEAQCAPHPDWCANIIARHQGPYAAVGGAVEKGSDTALNWAVYLCDFSRYMNPVPEGCTDYLTDCNVSYKRHELDRISALWEEEFHETTVNWALKGRGKSLYLCPRIVVQQQRDLRLLSAIGERYQFGRLFASTRIANASLTSRLFYAGMSCMLPLVLTFRIAQNVVVRRRHYSQLMRAAPYIALFNCVWSFGEFLGYLTGRPAAALSPQATQAPPKHQHFQTTA